MVKLHGCKQYYMKRLDKILKDALVSNNVLSESELDGYQEDASIIGNSLRDFLIERGLVTENQILVALSQECQMDTISFKEMNIEQEVLDRVPIKIAWYYKFIPIKIVNNILTIASAVPYDVRTTDEIRMHIRLEVKVILTQESELNEAFKKFYGFASDTIDRIKTKEPMRNASSDDGKWIEDIEQQTDDPTVSHLVNQIILEAYKKRATDIHIEPYRNKVRFRYRIDGALVDANLPDDVKHFVSPILSRIKILANLSITEKRVPQDGSAVVKTSDQQLDLRVSTIPTPRGESMVIRILPTKTMRFSLEKLGFNAESAVIFKKLLEKPHGILFMTGPTGSGKTTTLYACLNEINSANRKIITIEDPVEYEMSGVTQVQVNPKVNFTFAEGLRSILRHDPDILMVGEVRDPETAEIAIKTALTGHLVFSTLHTNDAASGITRLIDMGIEAYLVSSSVEAFVAQRLVREICPKCKVVDEHPKPGVRESIAQSLKISNPHEIVIHKGTGCEFCNETGYYGRKAIYEIMAVNNAIRAAILEKPRSDYIKKIAMQEGMKTLRQSGWVAVLNGETTPQEVLNVTVKDEDEDILQQSSHAKSSIVNLDELNQPNELKFIKIKRKGDWVSKNQLEARTYPRVFEAVEIRYQLMKKDPENPSTLISDGIEYPTLTEDISAAGLRFISKVLLPIGSILELKIQLGEGQSAIQCLGKVCRVEEDSFENVYTMVCYYLDISSADKVLINKFVQKKMDEENVAVRSETTQ